MTRITVVSTIMRIVMGILFLAHGISKLQMGLGNVEAWFGSLGLPGLLAYAVAALELVGGIMLIVGLFTRYVSAIFTVMLLGAIVTTKFSAGLLGNDQMAGYEMDLSFMLVTIYLTVAAPTALSIDQLFLKKRSA
ncbi:DoxX family protein [Paenibacillus glacialis]|uniref:Oxidoreductase n=1 Tax=Paenibacillus glacialis TaxID=494026 RepID=A0A162K8L9_9BACL|nr:DoxX family protein [Paenibacillus glacialis]OAB42248.1 oxidoreductase [Paenibacillus glacialis]